MSRSRPISRQSYNSSISPISPKSRAQAGKSVNPYLPSSPQRKSIPLQQRISDTKSTCSDLDLMPKNDMVLQYQAVAESLYNFSIGIETRLDLVLGHILKYRNCAPLEHHTFDTFVTLIDSGAACPADCQYLLLTIPAMMFNRGMRTSDHILRQLISKAKRLLEPGIFFISFGNQQIIPRAHIKEMIELFESLLKKKSPKEDKNETFGTKTIEKFVAKQGVVEIDTEEKKLFLQKSKAMFDIEMQQQNQQNPNQKLTRNSSIDRFLADKRPLKERIQNGSDMVGKLSKAELDKIKKLAKLFMSWETAYQAVQKVWDQMKQDPEFEVNILISMMPITFADFTISGLKRFAVEEGIKICDLPVPKICVKA